MSNVLYSSARAVVSEKTLFGAERIKRLIEAEKTEDIFGIFAEVNFGGERTSDENPDAEKVIETEYGRLMTFVREESPDENFKKLLLFPADFKNAEALVKAKFLKTDYADMLSEEGLFDVKRLKEKVFADDYDELPKFMANALSAVDKAFVDGQATGKYINGLFVKALYEELFALKIKDRILTDILKAKADFINVNVAIRTRNYGKAKEFFVHTGEMSQEDLKFLCEKTPDEMKDKFKFREIYPVLEKGINAVSYGKGLSEFETAAESYPVVLLKKYRYSSEGYLPFIRFCYYKLADIMNARVITVGKNAKLSKDEISARLKEYYEG